MSNEWNFGNRPMSEAPRDREIFFYANMSPFDETPFLTKGHFSVERNCFVVKDDQLHGLPSFGLISVNALSWASFM